MRLLGTILGNVLTHVHERSAVGTGYACKEFIHNCCCIHQSCQARLHTQLMLANDAGNVIASGWQLMSGRTCVVCYLFVSFGCALVFMQCMCIQSVRQCHLQVEEKYMRMQILCMHKPRWRRDLIASQHKPATFARLLGVSHRSAINH